MIPIELFGSFYPAAVAMAGVFFSLLLEKLAHRRCPGLRRPLLSVLLHGGLLLLAWAIALLVVRRPAFALLLTLAGQFAVIQVNNAKYRALREPFLFSDFGIFSQIIKHPRLYFPFLGIGRFAAITAAIATAVLVGWRLEPAVEPFVAWAGLAALSGALLLAAGLLLSPEPSLDPVKDMARQGLFSSIAQYWLCEKVEAAPRNTSLPSLPKRKSDFPDVVVVQSESFFDARRLFTAIRHELLANYDAACKESSMHGLLEVPAWGANTMRPEFSFLTGIEPKSLGIHRFNPYRRVAKKEVRGLPAVLREAGYKTTCIHPHPARFFRRDRAFPNLGFDKFVDESEFKGAEKSGPYISDRAVTDKLIERLEKANEPSFFFVITMENHGPLHLEGVSGAEERVFYTAEAPTHCEDLSVYLRHLRNADCEIGRLRHFLRHRSRPYVLCFYGEHLPSMPKVYDQLGLPDGRTDYFLETSQSSSGNRQDTRVEALCRRVLEAVGK